MEEIEPDELGGDIRPAIHTRALAQAAAKAVAAASDSPCFDVVNQ